MCFKDNSSSSFWIFVIFFLQNLSWMSFTLSDVKRNMFYLSKILIISQRTQSLTMESVSSHPSSPSRRPPPPPSPMASFVDFMSTLFLGPQGFLCPVLDPSTVNHDLSNCQVLVGRSMQKPCYFHWVG